MPYEKPEHPPDWMKTRSPSVWSAGWSAMRPLSCSRAVSEIVTVDGELIAIALTSYVRATIRKPRHRAETHSRPALDPDRAQRANRAFPVRRNAGGSQPPRAG